MTKSFYLLGQSNYAVSILLDTLRDMYPGEKLLAWIVANIPAQQNDSLAWPYETPGVDSREIWWADWQPDPDVPCLLGSIGRSRRSIVQFFEEKFGIGPERYGNTVHPSAVVPASVAAGRGIHISPCVAVGSQAGLGDFVVLNRSCSVGHHTVLNDYVTVNPGVTIAGLCRIDARVTIGAGATVLDRVSIGADSIIGAGSVVTKDLPSGVVAYGVPAKVIRILE